MISENHQLKKLMGIIIYKLNGFIKREIDKKSLIIDETIELLVLSVKNKIEWEWQE